MHSKLSKLAVVQNSKCQCTCASVAVFAIITSDLADNYVHFRNVESLNLTKNLVFREFNIFSGLPNLLHGEHEDS